MKRLAILIVFLITNVTAYAQVDNDECENAQTITPNSTCYPIAGTLEGATSSSLTSGCYGNSDVFYKFDATSSITKITVESSSGLDVVVSIFSTCGSSVSLYCADSYGNGGTEEILITGLYLDTTYYIKVQAKGSILPSTYTFSICTVNSTDTTVPSNDECVNAQLLVPSLICSPVRGTLEYAATSTITNGCSGYSDVYYKFIALAPYTTITVSPSYSLDAIVSLFGGCSSLNSAVVCVNSYGSGGVETFDNYYLTVGATYYIKVQGLYPSYATTFSICVESANIIKPVNDDCSNAINLTPSLSYNYTPGTLLNATNSSMVNSCSGTEDVFYAFEATATTAEVHVLPSAGMNAAIGVFESCNGVRINCTNDASVGSEEITSLSGLVIGNTYFIQVENSASSTTTDFSICVISGSPAIPTNDECINAIELYPNPVYTPVSGTVKLATISTTTPSCTGNSDVFYKFTARARAATITVVGSSGLDPVVGLFGSCGTPHMDCVDFNYNPGGTEVMTPTNLIIGEIYYIKIQDYDKTLPTSSSFTVAVQSAGTITATDASTSVQQISLYPNPIQNILHIEHVQMETTIKLVDIRGTVLLQKNISSDDQIDLSEFAAGIYLLKLSVDGVVENRRVVINK